MFLVVVLLLSSSFCQAASDKSKSTSREIRREKILNHYLKMYGFFLQERNWIDRAMAVISLSRIDDPRVTEMLLDVLDKPYSYWKTLRRKAKKNDPDDELTRKLKISQTVSSSAGKTALSHKAETLLVKVMAWEALHARANLLTKAQHKRWKAGTLVLLRNGQFRGAMRTGLLRLLAPEGPTPQNKKLFLWLFLQTNSRNPKDSELLCQMSRTLAKWHCPKLTKQLINALGGKISYAPRADYLLRGFENEVPNLWSGAMAKGSKKKLGEIHQAWIKWYKSKDMKPAEAGAIKPYEGTSRLISAPERIVNSADPKWRKGLEIGKLRRNQLDVAFVVDSTGSMKAVVNWMKRDVHKMLHAFAMVGRKPRGSVVFYRDHGDQYVTKLHSLTSNANALSKAIRGAKARGGGDVPEAVYDALAVARYKQEWAGGKRSHRVIILIGDAPPHKKDMPRIKKLIDTSVKKGFKFYCIKVRTRYGSKDLGDFDKIAKWGNGKSFWVDFRYGGGGDPGRLSRDFFVIRTGHSVRNFEDDTADVTRMVVREVMTIILSEAYSDRVKPFSNVLLEYLDFPIKERRGHFPPRKKTKPRKRRGKRKPAKPYDPQRR